MFKLIKEVRDINRLREILTVLFEEGFDFLIEKIRLKHRVPVTKRVKARIEKKKKFSIEKRLRLTLERLGPTFIKFGQVLSVRPDLIPKSYIKELENLQDKVPSFPYDIVK
ncbi:MAG: ABC transporter, partial [Thaumarchaeota archaeon]|nr:ABC transporter [Nitrososphaerota archaeon]